MAKNKLQKKKERERRVAKKKLATTAKRRALEKSTNDSPKTASQTTKLMKTAIPKTSQVAASKKNTFTQRRSGG